MSPALDDVSSMFTTSLMKRRCVLACCCSGLWSSSTHLAGFLWLKRMPTQELLHPNPALTDVDSLCVEPFVHQARIVIVLTHKTSVTRMMCSLSRVVSAGKSRLFLPCLRFQRYGVFWLIPVEQPGAQAPDLTQATQYAPGRPALVMPAVVLVHFQQELR